MGIFFQLIADQKNASVHFCEGILYITYAKIFPGSYPNRGLLVAKLLSLRQDEMEQNEISRKKSIPFFQTELFQYLNDFAPIKQHEKDFQNLICLYAELIRHDVFSHAYYVSSLISRGEVSTQGGDHGEESRHYIFLRHVPIPMSVTVLVTVRADEDVDDQKG